MTEPKKAAAAKKQAAPTPPSERDQTQPLPDEKAPSYDDLSPTDLITLLAKREPPMTQAEKDHVNANLARVPNDPDDQADYLRAVARALDAKTPLPEWQLPPETDEEPDEQEAEASTGGGDGDGGAGGEPEVAPGSPDGANEGNDTHDVDPAGPDRGGEPYPDHGWDALIELIRDEGGAAAVDAIDQRTAFLSTTDTIPYLRRYALWVVDGQDGQPPLLDRELAAQAEQVARETAERQASVIKGREDEGGGQPGGEGPPAVEQVPLGDLVLHGFRVGQRVRVSQEDRYSDYNGHVGWIEEMDAGDGEDAATAEFTIRFHQQGEDPGSRPTRAFSIAEIAPVVE